MENVVHLGTWAQPKFVSSPWCFSSHSRPRVTPRPAHGYGLLPVT